MAPHDSVPLCIDLDGTLIRSDTLLESLIELAKAKPITLLKLPFWLVRGRAYLKARIAERVSLAAETLPYREDLVNWARAESVSRPVVLVTAAHRRTAESVASHLGLFREVMATDDENLKANRKAQALVQKFGAKGFDYAGNASADLPVWRVARRAIVVGAPRSVAALARSTAHVDREFDQAASVGDRVLAWVRALRLYQWVKNLLVFVAPVAAHRVFEPAVFEASLLAFLSFGFAASGIYLLNDLLDLANDRRHPRKRNRPFARGQLPIAAGLAVAPVLIVIALALGLHLGAGFTAALAAYLIATCTYSLWLKRKTFIDTALLAGLYTLRVAAGAFAVGLVLSFWLIAVCAYGFLGLALLKRYSELRELEMQQRVVAEGRGYVTADLPVVLALGVGSSLLATLVTALYIESYAGQSLYSHPEFLWALVGLMLLGVGRLWLIAGRGAIRDDPIVFVVQDRWTSLLLVLAAGTIAAAM